MRIAMLLCCFVGALLCGPGRRPHASHARRNGRSMKGAAAREPGKPYFIAYRATERDVSSLGWLSIPAGVSRWSWDMPFSVR